MVTVNGNLVEFRFYRPHAKRVYLVGDFNNWREQELAMGRNEHGYWIARVHLPPGEYKFRYLADGRWYTDYASFGVCDGPFGMDSVLLVRAPEALQNHQVA